MSAAAYQRSGDHEGGKRRSRLVVGIATVGRPDVVGAVIADLARQKRIPDRIIICPASDADLPAQLDQAGLEIVRSERGTCPQRNAIIEACREDDFLVFFDDDFLPHRLFLEHLEEAFLSNEDIVVLTGHVVADGVNGPGISVLRAREILASSDALVERRIEPTYGAYGCNMAIRLSAVRSTGAKFDEGLPLYGWQEDIDFSRQLAKVGTVMRSFALVGVHMGHKGARMPGVRMGYSQVANPVYMYRKGTMNLKFSSRLVAKNFAANMAKSIGADNYVDRRGRLRGNFYAILDILKGRCHPKRVLDL